MESKKTAIAVAVISAVATIGAAVFSSLNKSESKSPSIQQTASGDGSVNVGGSAVFNTSKSAGEEAAQRVEACEEHHGMNTASEKTESSGNTNFRSCSWPKSRYADDDGSFEIKVRTVDGPAEGEVSGTNYADRITAPCQRLIVAYSFTTQGYYEKAKSFTIDADTVVTQEYEELWKNDFSLPFYPEANEFVVLHNGKHGIESASCL